MNKVCSYSCVLLFLVVVCLASSCRTPVATTSTVSETVKDSIIITYIPRFDTLRIKGDSIRYEVQIECDEKTNKPKPMKHKAKGTRAAATLSLDSNGLLKGTSSCDSLQEVIESKDREILHLQEKTRSEYKQDTVIQYKTRTIDIWCRWIAALTVLFIIIKIVLKIYRPI